MVASVTGAAIVGGHWLRGRLPGVGIVVFHLGALLLPVDALGLAYQLGASAPVGWAAVGATAVVALPVLAVVGRSRVLGAAGIAGVPVLATGLGLAGAVPPAVTTVVVAALATLVLVARRAGPRRVWATDQGDATAPSGQVVWAWTVGVAAPTLGLASVALPFLILPFAAGVRSPSGLLLVDPTTAIGHVVHAGWAPVSWTVPAISGAVAVAVLATCATRARDAGLAALTIVTGVLAVIVTLSPPMTPRAAWLLVPATVWLVAEVAATAARGDRLWATPVRVTVVVLEVIALLAAPRALGSVLAVWWSGPASFDPAMVVHLGVLAAAWGVVAVRRTSEGRGALAVLVTGLAALHITSAAASLGAGSEAIAAVLVMSAVASLGTLVRSASDDGEAPGATRGVPVPPAGAATGHDRRELDAEVRHRFATVWTHASARLAAASWAMVLLGVAVVVTFGTAAGIVVAVTVPFVLLGHVWASTRGVTMAVESTVVTLGTGTLLLALVASSLESVTVLPGGVGVLAVALTLLACAAVAEPLPPAADTMRALAAFVGMVLVVPSVTGLSGSLATDVDSLRWALALGLVPWAFLPAVTIGAWLVVDAVRTRRVLVASFAVPVALRALATGALFVGIPVPIVGVGLVVVGLGAAVVSVAGPRRMLAPSVTAAVLAGPVGWILIGDAPWMRAGVVIATGLAIVAVGAARRQTVVGHAGGVVTIVGAWQLLATAEVGALDVWLSPVAVHLAVAGELARRRSGTTSWIAHVPALLLVAVPALLERGAGGAGWHAVLAGTVAVVAIVAGGARRLGGPLVVGTVVLVAVVLIETFAVVAAVPTWTWLALGGVVLLGAAALIERSGGSPVRAVRRAVEVVGERFE